MFFDRDIFLFHLIYGIIGANFMSGHSYLVLGENYFNKLTFARSVV